MQKMPQSQMDQVEKIGEFVEREKKRQGVDEFVESFNKSVTPQSHNKQLHASVQLKQRVKTAGNGTRANKQ